LGGVRKGAGGGSGDPKEGGWGRRGASEEKLGGGEGKRIPGRRAEGELTGIIRNSGKKVIRRLSEGQGKTGNLLPK